MINSEWRYKAFVKADDCGAKRAVVFSDDSYITFEDLADTINDYVHPQRCVRCGDHHTNYSLINVQCSEQVTIH